MKTSFSPEVLEAWKDTVAAYRKLIATGDTSGWERYSYVDGCRLCKAVSWTQESDCDGCVLRGDCCETPLMYDTMVGLRRALNVKLPLWRRKPYVIQEKATDRLAALETVANKNLGEEK